MKQILLFLLFTALISCSKTERNCTNFKTGAFEYKFELNGDTVVSKFTRNDSIEVDYFNNKIDSFSIDWINDCEYIARYLSPKTMAEKQSFHFKILHTKGNTYTFESKIINDRSNRKNRGTVTKLN